MNRLSVVLVFSFVLSSVLFGQEVYDDFEGGGNIINWAADDCGLEQPFSNPFQEGMNTSANVLKYQDTGGQYANIRFQLATKFDLTSNAVFKVKVYVPSAGITGNQNNQLSLKLQNGALDQPWTSQSEIIKPIILDQWQELSFDFNNDAYINFNPNDLPPAQRSDFDRVLFQLNGENNNDQVLAYLDDVIYEGALEAQAVFGDLIWSDEFDVDGPIDTDKWFHQTQLPNGGSWYNGEIQHYTNREENSFVSDGHLHVRLKKETFTDQGVTKNYTSARLNSMFAFKYGKVEIKATLPQGVGTWPAMWMLGKNINEAGAYFQTLGFGTTSWPYCGEIDIMEHWGANPNFVQSAMHTPSSYGNTQDKGGQLLNDVFSTFHIYSMEWSPDMIQFFVDGVLHYTYNPAEKNADTWPFDLDQYLLLNIAVLPEISPSFDFSDMVIDYVRVYEYVGTTKSTVVEQPNLVGYPNPVQDYLVLEGLSNPPHAAYIYNLLGAVELELSCRTDAKQTVVEGLDVLAPGTYIVVLPGATTWQSFKFVKE